MDSVQHFLERCVAPRAHPAAAGPIAPINTGDAPQSFSFLTFSQRLPSIVDKIITSNAQSQTLSPQALEFLHQLKSDLANGSPLLPLLETRERSIDIDAAPDGRVERFAEDWNLFWRACSQAGWFKVPWYCAESYMYRLIGSRIGYADPSSPGFGVDPFKPQKLHELNADSTWLLVESAALLATHDSRHATEEPSGQAYSAWTRHTLGSLLQYCLWGNKVDLCYVKVAETLKQTYGIQLEQERANILTDHSPQLLSWWVQGQADGSLRQLDHIAYIVDNAGTEFLLDLVLIDFLLSHNLTRKITIHMKAWPTFVSDATVSDTQLHLQAIESRAETQSVKSQRQKASVLQQAPPSSGAGESKASDSGAQVEEASLEDVAKCLSTWSKRLRLYINQGRLTLSGHPFWNSLRFFDRLSADEEPLLHSALSTADLAFIKGDANYRRLVFDHIWADASVDMAQVAHSFPAPFVSLRTFKSDPAVGLQPGAQSALDATDPQWRVNGKRGTVLFVSSRAK